MPNTEMVIDSIRVSLMNYQRVVMLKEKKGERYLPCWIGPAEADAIAVKMQGVFAPRPLTHDFVCTIIDALRAAVKYAIISDLKKDIFYAKVILGMNNEQIEIDCRPSDALAIAVRTGVPIFADEKVLNKAGTLLDQETGKPIGTGVTFDEKGKPTELPSREVESIEGELRKKPPQFEAFSESTQEILSLAEKEAKRLNSNFVSTGHLLLALVKEIPTAANKVLSNLDINLAKIPGEIEASISQQSSIESGEAGLSPAVRKAIELSIIETKRLSSGKVQPEHILIGLVRQSDGIAANLLKNLGVNAERVYIELIRLYTQPWHEQQAQSNLE